MRRRCRPPPPSRLRCTGFWIGSPPRRSGMSRSRPPATVSTSTASTRCGSIMPDSPTCPTTISTITDRGKPISPPRSGCSPSCCGRAARRSSTPTTRRSTTSPPSAAPAAAPCSATGRARPTSASRGDARTGTVNRSISSFAAGATASACRWSATSSSPMRCARSGSRSRAAPPKRRRSPRSSGSRWCPAGWRKSPRCPPARPSMSTMPTRRQRWNAPSAPCGRWCRAASSP